MARYKRRERKRLISAVAVDIEKRLWRSENRWMERAMDRQAGVYEFKVQEETARLTEQAVRALNRVIEKFLDPLVDREGAEYLREAMRSKRQHFGMGEVRGFELLESVKRMLKRHKYGGPCPRCGGSKCGDCYGKGWVTVSMAARMRQEDGLKE